MESKPYIFIQRAYKPNEYARYITRAPHQMNFENFDFKSKPSLSFEDCSTFLAYLPNNYECGRIQVNKDEEKRPIMENGVKLYQYHISKKRILETLLELPSSF